MASDLGIRDGQAVSWNPNNPTAAKRSLRVAIAAAEGRIERTAAQGDDK